MLTAVVNSSSRSFAVALYAPDRCCQTHGQDSLRRTVYVSVSFNCFSRLRPQFISFVSAGVTLLHRCCASSCVEVTGTLSLSSRSVVEEENERGCAHICEHLAFNATTNYNNHDIVKFLETIGAPFGACQVRHAGPVLWCRLPTSVLFEFGSALYAKSLLVPLLHQFLFSVQSATRRKMVAG
jgi:hypothetical protein